jgi:hypothetical protein
MAIARLALFASELVPEPAPQGKRSYRRITGLVDEHIPRLDVLRYQAAPEDLAECRRQADSDAQEASQAGRLPLVPCENPIQGHAPRMLPLPRSWKDVNPE